MYVCCEYVDIRKQRGWHVTLQLISFFNCYTSINNSTYISGFVQNLKVLECHCCIVALHPFMQFVLQQNSVLEVAENVSNINAANLKTMAGVSGATFNLICHNSFTQKQDWLLTLVQNMQKYNCIAVTGESNRTCVPIDT